MSSLQPKVKKRNWAFVLYPESAPENWREILQQKGFKIAISPLHNLDTEPTGEVKKEHYHVIICYEGPTSFNVVRRITEELKQPIPIPLEQIRGYYRYFTHLDNPDKFQYSEKDIKTLNGFNISDFVELDKSEIIKLKSEICKYIVEKKIYEFSNLVLALEEDDKIHLKEIAFNHTYFTSTFINSFRNNKKTKGE